VYFQWLNQVHIGKYFRINGKEKTAIGVFNPDRKENRAFITFTEALSKKGLECTANYTITI